MTDQPHYPYRDGDHAVLGPEVFASADAETITWQGAIYQRDRGDMQIANVIQAAKQRYTAEQGTGEVPTLEALGYHAMGQGIDLERAQQQLTAVRDLRNDLREITGARWIADALDNILDKPAGHNAGPSVAEAAANDRTYWSTKYAGEEP